MVVHGTYTQLLTQQGAVICMYCNGLDKMAVHGMHQHINGQHGMVGLKLLVGQKNMVVHVNK
jgi:hypothetical protein